MNPWSRTFLANGIIFGSGLASGVLAARLLGVEDRGLLAALIFWPHFIAGVGALGLNEAIAIRIARLGKESIRKSTILMLSVALAVPLSLAGVLLIPHLVGESRQVHVLFTQTYLAALVPVTLIAMNYLAVLQGEGRFDQFNVQRILQAALYPALLIILWLMDALTVETAAISVAAGTGIVAIVRLLQVAPDCMSWPRLKEAVELVDEGARLHVANLAVMVTTQIDKIALIYLASNEELGFYVVASTAAAAPQALLVQTFVTIIVPRAARSGPVLATIETVLAPFRKLCLSVIVGTIALILVMPLALPLIFGAEFAGAVACAQILALAFALAGIKKALMYILRSWSVNRPGFHGEGLSASIVAIGAIPVFQASGVTGLACLVAVGHAAGLAPITASLLDGTGLTLRQVVGMTRHG